MDMFYNVFGYVLFAIIVLIMIIGAVGAVLGYIADKRDEREAEEAAARYDSQRAAHWEGRARELAKALECELKRANHLDTRLEETWFDLLETEMDLDEAKARLVGLQKDFDGQLELDRCIINGLERDLERAKATIFRYQKAAWLKDMEKVAANQPTWDLSGVKFIQYCDTCGCNPCKCVY